MGVLLDGLTKLINSNTQNMPSLVNSIKDAFKKDPVAFDISATEHTVNNVTKLTKPAKVPSWTKDTSLETYSKQIAMWTGKNEDVPEYVKYHDLMEELKKNKEIKEILFRTCDSNFGQEDRPNLRESYWTPRPQVWSIKDRKGGRCHKGLF